MVIVTLDKPLQGFEETWMGWILRDRQNEFPRGISDRLNHLPVIVQVWCDAIPLDEYTRYAGKGGALATVAGITSHTAIARITSWATARITITAIGWYNVRLRDPPDKRYHGGSEMSSGVRSLNGDGVSRQRRTIRKRREPNGALDRPPRFI